MNNKINFITFIVYTVSDFRNIASDFRNTVSDKKTLFFSKHFNVIQ